MYFHIADSTTTPGDHSFSFRINGSDGDVSFGFCFSVGA
jgi:hypothetical protein